MTSASAPGSSSKRFLEDACSYRPTQNGFYGVLSDGAGSAPLASWASKSIVTWGLDLLLRSSQSLSSCSFKELATNWCESIYQALLEESMRSRRPLSDYEATILFFIFCDQKLFLAQVGDGFVVTGANGNYTLRLLGARPHYVNETYFVTQKPFHLQTAIVAKDFDFVMIGSDGLESVSIDRTKKKLCEGFFRPFDHYLSQEPSQEEAQKELDAFLNSSRLGKRSADDKTLFVAKRILG